MWDSPNSAGIIIDAIRAAKIARTAASGGPILSGIQLLHEVAAGAVALDDEDDEAVGGFIAGTVER